MKNYSFACIFFTGYSADSIGVVIDTDSIKGNLGETVDGVLSGVGEVTETIRGETTVNAGTPQSRPASTGNRVFWHEEQLSFERIIRIYYR